MDLRPKKNSLDQGYMLHWYEITKVIGRGGFGITYLAHDNNLDRNVAIKEFMPEDFATRESDSTVHPKTGDQSQLYDWGLERFIAEARTLAKFNHPNIVRVLSVFEENNTAYMVMEYAIGKDLSRVYKKEPKFDEERLLDTFIPIMDGLSLVHNAGFIHRDIKPANIYICENNSPLLLDFGSARQSIGGKTKALTSLVTFGYAPYEQYNEGSGKQGPWTDIYSLGATIYFGITGKKPVDALFRGGSFLEKGIDTYEPLSIIAKNEYSENFLLAIDKALMFKIDERPKNILTWADMLLGKTEAPQLPDYMLHPPEEDDATEMSWSDTELGYNTDISNASKSGLHGLVDRHGKRNTDYTEATVVRKKDSSTSEKSEAVAIADDSVNRSASNDVKEPDTSGSQLEKNWKVIALGGSAAVFLVFFISWFFTDSSSPEDIAETQKIQQLKKAQQEKLVLQQQKVQRAEKIQQALQLQKAQQAEDKNLRLKDLLSKAEQLAIAQNYTQPVDNNALYFYQQVLKLEADNRVAKDGIENIESQLLDLANSAYESEQYKKSEDYLAQVKLIDAESSGAKFLQDKLNKKLAQNAQLVTWLSLADTHIKNNRYTSPENKNAFDVYKKILDQQPDNRQALDGIQNIQTHYAQLFKKHISKSQLKSAQRDIGIMEKISAPAADIKQMQKTLNKSKQQQLAKNKSKPKQRTVKKLNIELVSKVIGQFKSALQSRNTKKIKNMSQFVPGRKQFVEQLHSQYRSLNVKVSNLRLIPKENKAQAHIEVTDLIDINGNKISPGNWSKFEIALRYNNRNQLKVYW